MEKHTNPIITVVMPAYNAEAYIERAINSVLTQSLPDWELICIDDGSTDGTQEIIRIFANSSYRIKLILQENSGPAEARRRGYIAGIGDYFIMLDADDWFGPDTLKKLLAEALETGAQSVVCRAMLSETGVNKWASFHEQRGTMQGQHLTGQEAFALTFPWKIHGICLWRQEVIKSLAVDPVNSFNRFNADEYLTRKLFLQCKKVFVGSGEYFVYPNQNSITRKRSWRHFLSLETDRRLTDLALDAGLNNQVVRSVLKHQRQNIIFHISRFARYGGDGEAIIVLKEIYKSIFHYYRISSRVEGRLVGISIFYLIIRISMRSFMGRLSFLRRIYEKISFNSLLKW
jgi:glycosyltransferase involved in cell wall biosynthesis